MCQEKFEANNAIKLHRCKHVICKKCVSIHTRAASIDGITVGNYMVNSEGQQVDQDGRVVPRGRDERAVAVSAPSCPSCRRPMCNVDIPEELYPRVKHLMIIDLLDAPTTAETEQERENRLAREFQRLPNGATILDRRYRIRQSRARHVERMARMQDQPPQVLRAITSASAGSSHRAAMKPTNTFATATVMEGRATRSVVLEFIRFEAAANDCNDRNYSYFVVADVKDATYSN